MPNIQLAPRNFVPTVPYGAAPADTTGAMMAGQAITDAGRELERSALMLNQFAQKKQAAVNRGIMAGEDTRRMETAAAIEQNMQDNPAEPERWEEFGQNAWQAYEQGRTTRSKDQKWAQDVLDADGIAKEDFYMRASLKLKMATGQGEIRKSNAQIKANAQAHLRAGDPQAFVDIINGTPATADAPAVEGIDATEEQRLKILEAGLEEGTYNIASNQMDAIGEGTLADQVADYEVFIDRITQKNADGGYEEFEYRDSKTGIRLGGMSIGARTKLQSTSYARSKYAQRTMDATGVRLIKEIINGRATKVDFDALLAAGDINDATLEPLLPKIEAAEEYAKAVAAADLSDDIVSRTKREDTATNAALKGTIGADDINAQVRAGDFTPEAGRRIIAKMNARTKAQQSAEDSHYSKIKEKIEGQYASVWKWAGKDDIDPSPSDSEYQEILANLTEADLTEDNRLSLGGKFLKLRSDDLADLTDDNGRFGEEEQQVRLELIKQISGNMKSLGGVSAGELMFAQDLEVSAWFDKHPNPSEAQLATFLTDLKVKGDDTAALELTKGIGTQ